MNTECHFESTEQHAVKIPFEIRAKGLNKLAQIRAEHFKSANEQLVAFMDDMRDNRNEHYADNILLLSAILFLAHIPKARHGLELNQFTREERIELIKAVNLIKAASSLLPRNLSLPN
ncbi:DUF5347 family protein [Xenorhabdus cabanillasii]|uniref:DUF5347 family protein n=2 Tax=Xenorhabdus cabanillasii TaxID=351673 RepID=UPI000C03C8B9|nr:DUF5347 family protein [Xenorhabdus cabanillasii]PHM75457.1 Phage-related protein [Xenorhabdus cabanillasii JM26]